MENTTIARKIVLGYINSVGLDFEDKLIEIANVNTSDEYLLEHINIMLEVLNKAKKELEVKNDSREN